MRTLSKIEKEDLIERTARRVKLVGDTKLIFRKDMMLIAETLLRLPDEVMKKVLREVYFIVVPFCKGYSGTYRYSIFLKQDRVKKTPTGYKARVAKPLIFLNFEKMKKESKFSRMSTVAHEIAHFILDHDHDRRRGLINPIVEKEADDLTEEWSFKRAYKDYNKFKPKKGKKY